MDEHRLLLYLAGVPVLGMAAQWIAWRIRLPSILLLLAFGVLLGTFVSPDELLANLAGTDADLGPKLLFPVVSLSVAVILFEGGLTLKLHELREAGSSVLRLVTVGAAVSWLLTAAFARICFAMDWHLAALVGAILVVTGPTVVAPMLRHIRPSRKISRVVKWEGIVIDPIGAVLAVLVFEEALRGAPDGTLYETTVMLVRTGFVGGVFGYCGAWGLGQCIKRYLVPDYMHGVLTLAVVLGLFALSNHLQHESGLVTVTVLGIALTNQRGVKVEHIVEFKEHLGIFLISCLFIVLGSRLDIGSLSSLGIGGAGFLAMMILVVRPASVFAATIGTELNWRERLFIGFLAPRGIVAAAVSSVFALKLVSLANADPKLVAQAEQIVPITFLVILGTVSVYGLAASPMARWLKLADPSPQGILFAGAEPWVREMAKTLNKSGVPVFLVDTNYGHIAAARMDGLRAECASILSEHVREELDLAGIGRMLAMTSNDEVNALAVREFAHLFGRANVYQLPPWDQSSGRRTSITERHRGRLLFDAELDHDHWDQAFYTGASIKKTQLTEEFGYADFLARYGSLAKVLFIIGDNKKLGICATDKPIEPVAGHSLIFLVLPAAAPVSQATDTDGASV